MVTQRPFSEPFFRLPVLAAVLGFAVNNFYLKSLYPGWWTGKVSDCAAAFFLPLFIAALIARLLPRLGFARFYYGTAITVLLFLSVKASRLGSELLNAAIDGCTVWSGLHLRTNLADPTDLIALPLCGLALKYARQATRLSDSKAIP